MINRYSTEELKRVYFQNNHGPSLRDLCWSGERSQDHQERPEGEALQDQGKADQAQQVCARPHQRGRRLRSLREKSPGAAQVSFSWEEIFLKFQSKFSYQNWQGEEMPEVFEEKNRLSRPGQEEEGGDAGRPAGHEKEASSLILFLGN